MKKNRHRGSRRGFTLLELMVALVIGALVVAAVFTLGGASSRHFQEQQRIGVTQRSVRMAMDRLRRDVARAGYLGVSDNLSPHVRMCPTPVIPRRVRALFFVNDDGNAALDAVNRATNGVSADKLRLVGNYTTGEHYLVRAIDGNRVYLQTDWLGFRRSFLGSAGTIDPAGFANVFTLGRMLHIETQDGAHFVVDITGASANAAGTEAYVTVSPSLGGDNLCLRGFGRGAVASPLSWIEYSIGAATGNLVPNVNAVTGENTVLYRRELNMTDATGATVITGTTRPVLEYAVDFNLRFFVDQAALGAQPSIAAIPLDGNAAQTTVQNEPWKVRSVIASIAARTPEQDRRFPWPTTWAGGRPAGAPLNRFLVFPGRPGAARVRQLTTEIYVPNLVPR